LKSPLWKTSATEKIFDRQRALPDGYRPPDLTWIGGRMVRAVAKADIVAMIDAAASEGIEIVPLYMASPRPTVERDGLLLMVDDERFPLLPGETPQMRSIRFRTLGCYPLTGAIESDADTLPAIIQEMLLTTSSERQGRVIDHDQSASMEKKKQEGYF